MPTAYKSPPTPHLTHPVIAASVFNNLFHYGVYPRHRTSSPSPTYPTSFDMSSPQTAHTSRASQPSSYTLVPSLQISEASTSEVDMGNSSWMVTTVIEDDDLMFGGKPLSAWYEEDRRRLSMGDEEEERRGRQRERVRVETTHQHHHHQYHHNAHQQQHHHAKKTKEVKQ